MDERTSAERWAPVFGFAGLYEVSDQGRVRSLDRFIHEVTGLHRPHRGRVLKPSRAGRDHRWTVQLGRRNRRYISILVLEAFIGPRPPEMEGCHNNGDLLDNRLTNLRWDTSSGNKLDKRRHGTDHHRNRTHCPRQHPLAAPNLVARDVRRGFRSCLACARARAAEQRAEASSGEFSFKAVADQYHERIMSGADLL